MVKVVRVGEPEPAPRVDNPQRALRYWKSVIEKQAWFDAGKEHMIVLLLNVRYDIQGYSLVSIGSLNEAMAAPREVFRAAIASGAFGIITLHNHPSGCVNPSQTDRGLFDRLNEAGDLLQIRVLDHLIVGTKRGVYYAFKEEVAGIEERNANRRRRKLRRAAAQRRAHVKL